MQFLEIEEITEQKINGIESMIEQLIIDSFLTVLRKICGNQEQARQKICYKNNCPMRDDIPF